MVGVGWSTNLFREGPFNRSSRLRAGADSGAGCALLWGVTIRGPVRGLAGGGLVVADADVGAERGGCGAIRSKFDATVRIWRFGASIFRILVSWSTVIVGDKPSRRVAKDCAVELAAGGGVASSGGTPAG